MEIWRLKAMYTDTHNDGHTDGHGNTTTDRTINLIISFNVHYVNTWWR